MEFGESVEYLIDYFLSMVQYGKWFAIAVAIAFLVVFGGLIIVNSNLHEVKEELKEIKAMMKGENENG